MIKNKKLKSGVQVVMEQIPYVKSVTMGIWVKTGAVNEIENEAGISHYIEHMLFKGTEKRSAKDIAHDIDKIGGQINAFTGKESTCYYIKTLENQLESGAEVLCDLFFNSIFDKIEMEKEKQVVFEEINMHEDTPEDLVHDMFYELLFKDNTLSNSILGTPESLGPLEAEDLRRYMAKHYIADHIVVSIAGKFDEARIIDLLEEAFSKVSQEKPSPLNKEDTSIYLPSNAYKSKDIEQTHINMGLKGLNFDHDLYYAMAILNNVIGGSMSSRLFQNIREEKGLAYSIFSYATSYMNQGAFEIYGGVNSDKIELALSSIFEEIKLIDKLGITKEELESSKEQIKGSYIFGLESTSSRMVSLGKNQIALGRVKTPDEIIGLIDQVNMDHVRQAMDIISNTKNYSVALIGRDEKGILNKIPELM